MGCPKIVTSPKEEGLLERIHEPRRSYRYLGNYTLKELPQPQVLFTFGLLNLKPAPSSVST
jgi:hypothetical protein